MDKELQELIAVAEKRGYLAGLRKAGELIKENPDLFKLRVLLIEEGMRVTKEMEVNNA